MRKNLLLVTVALLVSGSAGCASSSLKESNRRLKESNDRLIAENTRLEQDMQRLQQELAGGGAGETAPVATAEEVQPELATNLDNDILMDGLDPTITVDRTPDGIRLRLPDRVFFAPGQAKLTSRGQRLLRKVGLAIANDYSGHVVRVEGHTDDTPTRKVKHLYPTNWELSTARACSVVRYLVNKSSVSPRKIFPAGYSYYRPLAQGRSSSARQRNRRVEITILNRTL